MQTVDLINAKAQLRKTMRRVLAEHTNNDRIHAGEVLCDHMAPWFKEKWPKGLFAVALFASLPDEINISSLDNYLMTQGIFRFVPLVHESHSLFVKIAPHHSVAHLDKGTCFIGSDIDLDVILVPGLAFDKEGHRLGRGKGYYDRALFQLKAEGKKPVIVGLAMDEQIVAQVPYEKHDVPMDYLCTPQLGMLKIS